mmetsp:Transcript_7404/g.13176  ORF Transcript_7404/g.13176 Transcript_7404/m.13176 type:complete len:253 (+) Transcript_7404:104-862(+)
MLQSLTRCLSQASAAYSSVGGSLLTGNVVTLPKFLRSVQPADRRTASSDGAGAGFGEESSLADTWSFVGLSNAITAVVVLTMSLLQVLLREATVCTVGVIFTNLGTKVLKHGLQRVAPPHLWRRPQGSSRNYESDPGFPSSHTTNMTFVSMFFATLLHTKWTCSLPLAATVALVPSVSMAVARIWDRDHTFLQTLGGLVWGAILGWCWALRGPQFDGMLAWQSWVLVALCFAVGLPMFLRPLRYTRTRRRPA